MFRKADYWLTLQEVARHRGIAQFFASRMLIVILRGPRIEATGGTTQSLHGNLRVTKISFWEGMHSWEDLCDKDPLSLDVYARNHRQLQSFLNTKIISGHQQHE